MHAIRAGNGGPIEVQPLVVVARAFPARPSSLPLIREFVRQRLGQSDFTEDDIRALCEQLLTTLLEVAGPNGMIQVSARIFPDHAEIDVLPATLVDYRVDRPPGNGSAPVNGAVPVNGSAPVNGANGSASAPVVDAVPVDRVSVTFAEWFAAALRREGMTMEAAARRLQVSVKTVSRWVGGSTEPRLRDLSRIREIFGDVPM
jgi:hypothetical protein